MKFTTKLTSEKNVPHQSKSEINIPRSIWSLAFKAATFAFIISIAVTSAVLAPDAKDIERAQEVNENYANYASN